MSYFSQLFHKLAKLLQYENMLIKQQDPTSLMDFNPYNLWDLMSYKSEQ